MKIDKQLLKRLFILVAGCILFSWLVLDTARASALFRRVWVLISPFVVGAAIAFVFNVPMRAIEKHLTGIPKPGLRRVLSIILTLLCLVLVIMFVFELLIPQIQLTAISLSQSITIFAENTASKMAVFLQENPQLNDLILDALNLETLNWSVFSKEAFSFLSNKISVVVTDAFSMIGNLTDSIVNVVISIVFAIYCLSRKEVLAVQGKKLLYSFIAEHHADEVIRILRLTNTTFFSFISGQCLEACILGCLFAVVMAILKMPYVVLISVVIAVTALIPVVGAFVGCFVGAFFILVNSPVQALTFIVTFLVIQQLENNLIYPRVVGTSIGLPGMWVLVAVTIGGDLMGVGGMLLMIPLTSVIYTLLREFTDKRLCERGIPEEKLMPPPESTPSSAPTRQHDPNHFTQKLKDLFKKVTQK